MLISSSPGYHLLSPMLICSLSFSLKGVLVWTGQRSTSQLWNGNRIPFGGHILGLSGEVWPQGGPVCVTRFRAMQT